MISIIIPVYNVEKYLTKCLDSCFIQKRCDLEVLAVNDGSTDASGALLDEYAQKESRLRVFHQQNAGVVTARNLGIKKAKGEWLAFVDSDDFLEVNAIELLYDAAIKSKADIAVAKYRNVSENGIFGSANRISNIDSLGQKELAQLLLEEKLAFSLCAKLFQRTLFNSVITDTSLKLGEDAYVTLQLFANAQKTVVVDAVVYNYLQRSSSATHCPSVLAINSILRFIEATNNFYKTKLFYTDADFRHSLNYFVMKEYFTYLRMGGSYNNDTIKDMVNGVCLNDVEACALTPKWRVVMLKAYRINILLGKIVKQIIVLIRNVRG